MRDCDETSVFATFEGQSAELLGVHLGDLFGVAPLPVRVVCRFDPVTGVEVSAVVGTGGLPSARAARLRDTLDALVGALTPRWGGPAGVPS